ncbi:MAG TPA: winged helix-turn-helix domain-containing protein [Paraburkholderia sp.]
MNSRINHGNETIASGYRLAARSSRFYNHLARVALRSLTKVPDREQKVAIGPDTETNSVAAPSLLRIIRFDPEHNRIQRGTVTVPMCEQEKRLLELLIADERKPIPKAQLIKGVWGARADVVVDANLAHLVCRLRKQLRCVDLPDVVCTVPGVGYALLVDGMQQPERREGIEPIPGRERAQHGEDGPPDLLTWLLIILSIWMIAWQLTSTWTEFKRQLPEGVEKIDVSYRNFQTTVYKIGNTKISYQNVLKHLANTCKIDRPHWLMYFISGRNIYVDLYTGEGMQRCVLELSALEKEAPK